jgi:hypothetical protein
MGEKNEIEIRKYNRINNEGKNVNNVEKIVH